MAIDHMVLKVPTDKYQDTLKFYTEALKSLNYELRHSVGDVVAGLGQKDAPTGAADLWLAQSDTPIEMHVAFRAESKRALTFYPQTTLVRQNTNQTTPDRAAVDAFHAAAIAAGATCNGPPGVRPQYHPDYYSAYITDPVGNNIEAVHHHPA
ncbi:hypothetical protein PWT90_10071 [Aphanocladium album]|nr:hypothetical protein PWT90_10071 [Aphanocladium album]